MHTRSSRTGNRSGSGSGLRIAPHAAGRVRLRGGQHHRIYDSSVALAAARNQLRQRGQTREADAAAQDSDCAAQRLAAVLYDRSIAVAVAVAIAVAALLSSSCAINAAVATANSRLSISRPQNRVT